MTSPLHDDELDPGTAETMAAIEALQHDAAGAIAGWQNRRETELEVLRDLQAVLEAAKERVTAGSVFTLPKRVLSNVLLSCSQKMIEELAKALEEPAVPFLTLGAMARFGGTKE